MTDKSLVLRLKTELEELGCEPVICGRCGSFENWPKTDTDDPLSDAQDQGATLDDLFCTCD